MRSLEEYQKSLKTAEEELLEYIARGLSVEMIKAQIEILKIEAERVGYNKAFVDTKEILEGE